MKRIEDMQQYDRIWDKIEKDFNFNPDYYLIKEGKADKIFTINNLPFKIFKIKDSCCGNEEWQKKINDILKNNVKSEMYALDWQHDAFIFNPNENITLEQSGWGDDLDNCICDGFPCYYPNGDYFLFVSTDFSQGLLGIPGFGEVESCLFVVGDSLIKEFEQNQKELNLTKF